MANLIGIQAKRLPVLAVFMILATVAILLSDYKMISPNRVDLVSIFAVIIGLAGILMILLRSVATTPSVDAFDNKPESKSIIRQTGVFSVVKYPALAGEFLVYISLAMYTLNPWFMILLLFVYPVVRKKDIAALDGLYKAGNETVKYEKWNSTLSALYPRLLKFRSDSMQYNWKNTGYMYPFIYAVLLFMLELLREYSVFYEIEITARGILILLLGAVISLILFVPRYMAIRKQLKER